MFVAMKTRVVGTVHVDDVLLFGETSLCLKILEEIKIKIMIRETGRALKSGDMAEFFWQEDHLDTERLRDSGQLEGCGVHREGYQRNSMQAS